MFPRLLYPSKHPPPNLPQFRGWRWGFTASHRNGYYSHMTTASISTTKNHLSALLDQVRHGQRVLITDRGVPVAMLVQPDAAADADSDGRIQRLRRMGIITGGSGYVDIRKLRPPRRLPGAGAPLSDALQWDREGSR